ncbi:DUF6702 family protein [Hirschia litorea]|uniref:DUF6702 family protein n=1 Tax=Hirschia litorea TaxID=1199156 RepID=A0ABW2II80_9PROT
MKMRLMSCAVLAYLVLLGQGMSHAHPQKAAIATIEPNARTGVIEIVHRFSQHDAEHAAHMLGRSAESIISDPEVQQEFARYVISSFSIETLNGDEITLEEVGYEFDRGYIWVYQEAPLLSEVKGLTVRYSALQDIWPDQTNTVNVKLDGNVKTLSFTGRTRVNSVLFDAPLDLDREDHGHTHETKSHKHGPDTHTH